MNMTYQQILELFVLGATILAVIGIACLGARVHRRMLDKRYPGILNAERAPDGSEHLMDYSYASGLKEAPGSAQPVHGDLYHLFQPQADLIRKDKAKS
jgi:hypothetical protein